MSLTKKSEDAPRTTESKEAADPRDTNQRPKRVPIRPGTNLDYPEDRLDREKFAYRWFLDHPSRPGRIQQSL